MFVQRPYYAGYETEYLSWYLNRNEFLGHDGRLGLELVREVVMGENPVIDFALDQNQYRGFLFKRAS